MSFKCLKYCISTSHKYGRVSPCISEVIAFRERSSVSPSLESNWKSESVATNKPIKSPLLLQHTTRCISKTSSATIPITSTDESKDLLVKVENGIRKITFNRPHKKNAITLAMIMDIISALEASNSDEQTTVIVMTGAENNFTSGLDLGSNKSHQNKSNDSVDNKKVSETDTTKPTDNPGVSSPGAIHKPGKGGGFPKFLSSLVNCKKPIICLVNGPAVGFGVTMLGLCDAVYASENATFHTTFSRFGLPPELASTYTFPRIMGYARANNLLMFNNKINAQEAFERNLVSRVFPQENFHFEAMKVVSEYGKLPVKSLIYSKELVRGRQIQFLKQISKTEQSYFDPEVARKVKEQFLLSKRKA